MISKELQQELLNFVNELADHSRKVIDSVLSTGMDLEKKKDLSFVSKADKQIESDFIEIIKKRYPEHGVLGEEHEPYNLESDFIWTVDPIDGTEEFANSFVTYGCIIGLSYQKKAILGLIDHHDLDQRVCGSLDLGVFYNGKKFDRRKANSRTPRLGICKPRQFTRTGDHYSLFSKIVEKYDNMTCYGGAYVYTNAILGGLDISVDYNAMLYESVAVLALAKSLGYSYYTSYQEGVDFPANKRVGYFFGEPEQVADIKNIFDEYFSSEYKLYN